MKPGDLIKNSGLGYLAIVLKVGENDLNSWIQIHPIGCPYLNADAVYIADYFIVISEGA